MGGDHPDTATDPKIVSLTHGLVSYVRELVRNRHKPVRNCERYTSLVWLADLPDGVAVATSHDEELLVLDHVPHRLHPPLPEILKGWVDAEALKKPAGGDPELAEKGPVLIEVEQADGSTRLETATVNRSDQYQVLRAYQEWIIIWRQWAAAETAAEPRRRLYQEMSRMGRNVAQADDVYEVALGVGLLVRDTPEKPRLARHLITRRLAITTDRTTARITVALAPDSPAQFEDRDFLDDDDRYSLERAAQPRTELSDLDPHPLGDDTVFILQRWAEVSIDEGVRFNVGWDRRSPNDGALLLSLAPAILLRERDSSALVQYYDRIAASLSGSGARSPLGLAQLIAPLEKTERLAWNGGCTDRQVGQLQADPLFPLATNAAQRDVLDKLRSDTAVVVQGPPGTGKTHTIANLTCALLAQGQRVLVTSQKDQALRVLRDKLPLPVRDLCVLLTGLQRGGSDELERSVDSLSNQASSTNPAVLTRRITELESQRAMLLSNRARQREGIRVLREAEWVEHPEIAPGYAGTLAAITRKVIAQEHRYGWLPVLSAPPAHPPLDMAEMLDLRSLLSSATPTRQARRYQLLPDTRLFPPANDFADLVSAAQHYEHMVRSTSEITRLLCGVGDAGLAEITRHVEQAAAAFHFLGIGQRAADWDVTDWRVQALADRFARRRQALWDRVAASAQEVRGAQESLNGLGMRQVRLPSLSAADAIGMLGIGVRLRDYLASGAKLRQRFAHAPQRAAQPLLDSCTVDGVPISGLADLDAVIAWLRARVTAAEVTERWAAVGVRTGQEADSLPVILSNLADLGEALDHLGRIGAARDDIDRLLSALGIRLPSLVTPDGWDDLTRGVAATRALLDARKGRVALDQLPGQLPPPSPDDPPELGDLRRAVTNEDTAGYASACSALHRALQDQRGQRRCDELFARLRDSHVTLADQLAASASEAIWEQRLASWPEAWAWATARAFCVRARDFGRDTQQQQDLDETEWRLTRVTEELTAAHAWLHCLTRMSQEQRQALQSYRSAMTSLGKGTGRYAARHRRAARDAMEIARDAVPAWIMPLQKVVETIPPMPDSFDVVIVDEASQAGLDALFLLWLAARVIVVGDDKQCAPTFGVQEHQKVFDRLDAYLPDLRPAFRDDFRPGNNLYALLSARFPDVIRLTEHFRCMPEIIGWSSKQFYVPPLEPLRQFGADRLDPLKVVVVEGAYTEGRDQNIRNPSEAKQLVEKLHEMLDDPAYANKTFGVVALQGTGQGRLIEDLILASTDPAKMERHDIRVGTPPEFQGDERDVVLLSMVITEPRRALTRSEEQRRFNVAASRARDQMWLFTSVTQDRLTQADLRFSLLSYMQSPPSALGESPAADEVSADDRQPPFDSLFEQRVFLAIRRRGYHAIPQFRVGGRRIDLVVSGSSTRLAVECDGRVAHSTPDQVRSDMERERELRRVGWEFWRIRESEFVFDPEQALAPLWHELERRGIAPGVNEQPVGSGSSPWSPVELPVMDDSLDDDNLAEGR